MAIDAIKILESLRDKVRSENPDYSEKEVSAYIAGMICAMSLIRGDNDE